MTGRISDRLMWALAWQIVELVEKGRADTRLEEYIDVVDGRTLVLLSGDSPCRLVLNQSSGLTILAPIVFETLSWAEVVSRPLRNLVKLIHLSLAWDSTSRPLRGAALSHALISRVLTSTLTTRDEWWISSMSPAGISSQITTQLTFPTLSQQLLDQFETALHRGTNYEAGEVWVLHRDLETVAAFDSEMGMHVAHMRWDYTDLRDEVDHDLASLAFYCMRTIRAVLD